MVEVKIDMVQEEFAFSQLYFDDGKEKSD